MNGIVHRVPLAKNSEPSYNFFDEMASIITRKEQHSAREIDTGCRVKCNWAWLKEEITMRYVASCAMKSPIMVSAVAKQWLNTYSQGHMCRTSSTSFRTTVFCTLYFSFATCLVLVQCDQLHLPVPPSLWRARQPPSAIWMQKRHQTGPLLSTVRHHLARRLPLHPEF